jgi:hypothetical protein
MPRRKIKKGRFLNVLKNRPVCSALPSATENNHYAELGIMAIPKYAFEHPLWFAPFSEW